MTEEKGQPEALIRDPENKDWHAMMAAFNLCPQDMSTPDRMRWIAAEFRRRADGAQQPAAQAAGLTDEEIERLISRFIGTAPASIRNDCRALVLEALTRAAPSGEPVGYVNAAQLVKMSERFPALVYPTADEFVQVPIYTAPQPSAQHAEPPSPDDVARQVAVILRAACARPLADDEWLSVLALCRGVMAEQAEQREGAFAVRVGGITEAALRRAEKADPCPGCIPGSFCRTPNCARLKAQQAEPLGQFRHRCPVCQKTYMAKRSHSMCATCRSKQPAEEARGVVSGLWALAIGAAAALEAASYCMRDEDGRRAAEGAAEHTRRRANELLAAPAAQTEKSNG